MEIIIIAALAVYSGWVIVRRVKAIKTGNCGCGGSCGSCSGCGRGSGK